MLAFDCVLPRRHALRALATPLAWLTALLLLCGSSTATAAGFTLQKGDHICIIGNTLPERMQHFGWLETLLQNRFPDHELVIRNLGYSADELTIRMRSMDFGTPDQWLSASAPIPQPQKLNPNHPARANRFELADTKADVVFAFFGYNESFAGEAGLPKFKQDLAEFIQHTHEQKYNGKSAPRLVLFSPIAHEDLKNPNLPDGSANNARLKLYTAAMAEVAKTHEVTFVDLFTPTSALFPKSAEPCTINGVHITEHGDRVVSQALVNALFGAIPSSEPADPEKLRQAVLDKNFYWYHRYRTTDGYSTYGDRAFLRFIEGQTNYEVVQRELETLDVMTSNRDRRVWAAAHGRDLKVDDGNTPEYIHVPTNKPGSLAEGRHLFLTGEDAITKMTVHSGMKVSLFASEEKFPELINPVQMAFDPQGRLWVAAWPTYPHWKPKSEEMNDQLLILEDTDGDGQADKCKAFADKLHNPTGFEFWGGGVIVAMAPDLIFLKDTDGDDRADVRVRILHGLDTADTHHTANSFTLDPGGALYFQEGTFHNTQVESPWGPPQRVANGAVFRFEPRSSKFDVYVSFGFANPHGHVFDKWGQDVVVDGTGSNAYHGALFSGHVDFPQKHARPPQVYQQRTRPCPAIEILSSRHFPDELQGNLLVGNVIGFQGILQYKLHDQDASFGATEVEPILSSSDPNFRPADLEMGADGAIYFTDWQNPIIGHMQHNLRDPSRDKIHGRVYRVIYEGRPLLKPAAVAGQPVPQLLELLKDSDNRVRYRAKLELSGRNTAEVMTALDAWHKGLDKQSPGYEHDRLEVLWMHQHHNVVDPGLLEQVLASPDFHARAAAVRVLCYWRDRVSNALDLLKVAAADSHPRVRLEAVRAASFFPVAEAVEVPLIAADYPLDMYLEFQKNETLKTLDPHLKQAIAEGRRIAFTTEAGARFFLRNLTTEQLLKEKRNRTVFLEMLYRPGLQDEQRREAVQGLAGLDKKPELAVIMDAIRSLDDKQASTDISVVFDLVRQLTGRTAAELATARAELERLATTARQPVLRQIGFVSLINVDGKVEPAWELASKSAKSLVDFVQALPLISDPGVRASLYEKVEPLLKGLPADLAGKGGKGTSGRYVRIEIPTKATLTLAEVEVLSNGVNVARRGRAMQKNTGFGGDAAKAIDGKKDGAFSAGGQSHTEDNAGNPWWEVDLGEEQPIDQIVIYNRTDGDLGKRLDGFTLRVLDSQRNEVFRKEKNPAPKTSAAFEMEGSSPEAQVRHATMLALTSVRGQEAKTFATLSAFLKSDADRLTAIRALQRLPRSAWPVEQAPALLDVLLASIRSIPVPDRTSPAALDSLEFAHALANLLPADQAKKARAELNELGVRVIRIGTIFEKMTFDKETIAVQAGKPVEFILDNSDLMPHNFVITQPGSLEEIGLISEANAQQPSFAERNFVPDSPKILLASRLLQPRDTQKLSFTAPAKAGVYPYVCTYPGHWRRMYGALYVVDDLDDYQADPEKYLAAHSLPSIDPLLQDRRPRTEWKLADLAPEAAKLVAARSYGNGKQMFKVASCISCHKLDGQGQVFGPDLLKLDPKLTTSDILQSLLEPSAKIEEKYQSNVFELVSGKTLTGMVVEETKDTVKVIENPLLKAEPLVLKKSDIAERVKSPVSIMPKGLLDKLTRDEILDLVAYIASRGNKEHALFKGDPHEHHKHHKH